MLGLRAFCAATIVLAMAGEARPEDSLKADLLSTAAFGSNPGSASQAKEDIYAGLALQVSAAKDLPMRMTGRFHGRVSGTRHMFLGLDKEHALAQVSLSRPWRSAELSFSGLIGSEFDPQFMGRKYVVYEFGSTASYPIKVSEWLTVTPALATVSRLSDRADMARAEASPSLRVDANVLGGRLSMSADYSYRQYTYVPREDHYMHFGVSYERRVWTGCHGFSGDFILSATYERNISNAAFSDYEGFSVGPAIQLSWSRSFD